VTKPAAGSPALYIATERDNEANTVSPLIVATYDGVDDQCAA